MDPDRNKRVAITLIAGLILGALGLMTFLKSINMPLQFIPTYLSFLYNSLIIKVCLVIGGLILFTDSLSLAKKERKFTPIFIGLVLAILGAIPILLDYKLFDFLPITIAFKIPLSVLSGALILYGLYLIYTAIQLFRVIIVGDY